MRSIVNIPLQSTGLDPAGILLLIFLDTDALHIASLRTEPARELCWLLILLWYCMVGIVV
jgi:hypothetical protein